jgi:hypothetical protein
MPLVRKGFSKNSKGFDVKNIVVNNVTGSIVESDEVITGFLQADEMEVGSISFSQVGSSINFNDQDLSNVNITSGTQVNVTNGTFTNLAINGNINIVPITGELRISNVKVVGQRQSASTTVPTVTTKGNNIGVSANGLSLIGNTMASDQSLGIMNDLESLREDIVNLKVSVDSIRAVLINHGLMNGP